MQVSQEIFEKNRIIAVLVIDDVSHAIPVAKTLLENGISAMELTLRTPVAMEALGLIREKLPAMTAGVGTVLTREQVRAVHAAGAAFGVAPGLNRAVLDEATAVGLPFAPGIVTPSDMEAALEQGYRIMKFFPAEPSGGLAYLKSMAAPYLHLGVRFIPLGGLTQDNLGSWLESPLVTAVGGSWIAPRELIQEENWTEIGCRAAAASALAR